jgi:hypothetical protein
VIHRTVRRRLYPKTLRCDPLLVEEVRGATRRGEPRSCQPSRQTSAPLSGRKRARPGAVVGRPHVFPVNARQPPGTVGHHWILGHTALTNVFARQTGCAADGGRCWIRTNEACATVLQRGNGNALTRSFPLAGRQDDAHPTRGARLPVLLAWMRPRAIFCPTTMTMPGVAGPPLHPDRFDSGSRWWPGLPGPKRRVSTVDDQGNAIRILSAGHVIAHAGEPAVCGDELADDRTSSGGAAAVSLGSCREWCRRWC